MCIGNRGGDGDDDIAGICLLGEWFGGCSGLLVNGIRGGVVVVVVVAVVDCVCVCEDDTSTSLRPMVGRFVRAVERRA